MNGQKIFLCLRFIWHVRTHSIFNIVRSYVKSKAFWISLPLMLLGIVTALKELQRSLLGFKWDSDILFTIDAASLLCVASFVALCGRALLRWKKMKFKGAYESLAIYQPQSLGDLYVCYTLDRLVCHCIVVSVIGGVLFGNIGRVLMLLLLVGLIAFEEFICCLSMYVNASAFVQSCILLSNIVCSLLLMLADAILRVALLVLILGFNLWIFHRFGFCFPKYFTETAGTQGIYKNRFFFTILCLLTRLSKNAKLAFVVSKEIVQIHMEIIPLIYSFVYGMLFTVIALFSYKNTPSQIIILFCFFTSIAYTLVAIAFNFFARDKNKSWIYHLYNVSAADIMFGKYLAYGVYAIGVVIIYVVVYKLLAAGNGFEFAIHFRLICELLFMLVPVTFFIGAIAGSLLVPTIKYRNRNVDYNYHGMEIVMLLGTAYFISLPMCIFNYFLTDIWWIVLPLGVMVQCALGFLLKKRICTFLMRAN